MDLGGGESERAVAPPTSERVFIWLGIPITCAVATGLIGLVLRLVFDLGAVPFGFAFRLLHVGEGLYGWLAIGAGFGIAAAIAAHRELLTVVISSRDVKWFRNARTVEDVPRSEVDAVFLDGKSLVLLAANGAELVRESSSLSADVLREAFTAYGYPWRADGDPYRDEFRLWAEDLPGVPADAAPLLRARATAVEKRNRRKAAALRKELLRLGIVVRDEERLQYFRTVTPPEIEA